MPPTHLVIASLVRRIAVSRFGEINSALVPTFMQNARVQKREEARYNVNPDSLSYISPTLSSFLYRGDPHDGGSRATRVVILLFVYTKGGGSSTRAGFIRHRQRSRYCVEMRGRAMRRNY